LRSENERELGNAVGDGAAPTLKRTRDLCGLHPPCSGLQCSELDGLQHWRGKGQKATQYGGSKDVINYLWDLALSQQYTDCSTCADFKTKHVVEYSKLLANIGEQERKLYYGNGEAIVSTFCSGRGVFNGCCLECAVLFFQRSLHKRAVSLVKEPGDKVKTKCNRQHMTNDDVHQRLDDTNATLNAERLSGLNKTRGWERCQKRYERALHKLKKYSQSSRNYPKFIRYLQEAFELGNLDGPWGSARHLDRDLIMLAQWHKARADSQ